MTQRIEKLRQLFEKAVEIQQPEDRSKFLFENCCGDRKLLEEVEALLKAHDIAGSFLGKENLTSPINAEEATKCANESEKRQTVFGRGTIISQYKLLQRIGTGGMGAVWMAEQEKPVRRRVALKLILGDIGNPDTIARFEAERQALAMMEHPNIARVFDAGATESGTPWFVMELVKGIPITKYCDENKLGIKERLELMVPVCRAVQHAHHKGIIHRDLKPSNVLVTLYDGHAVPKIIDFGLAKALAHQNKLTDKTLFTEFGKVVGTLQYMSPEQAELNALDVDARTDIYSLGVLLYELLTGSTPIEKSTIGEKAVLQILAMIKNTEPPRPSSRLSQSGDAVTGISEQRRIAPTKLRDLLRGELDWIVMKALEKDRTRRYETANSLAADLERHLRGDSVEARPPSTVYQLRKFFQQNRLLFTSTAGIVLALILGLATTSFYVLKLNHALKENADKSRELKQNSDKLERQQVKLRDEKKRADQNLKLAETEKNNAAKALVKSEKSRAMANFFLAHARWDQGRAADAIAALDRIPQLTRGFPWYLSRRMFVGSDVTCFAHLNSATCVAVNHDGRIASGGGDSVVRVWDYVTGGMLNELRGHDSAVTDVEFGDNNEILYSTSDNKIICQNIRTGSQIFEIDTNVVSNMVFSSDLDALIVVSQRNVDHLDVSVFSAANGRLLKTNQLVNRNGFGYIYRPEIELTPDGMHLLVSGNVGQQVFSIKHLYKYSGGGFQPIFESRVIGAVQGGFVDGHLPSAVSPDGKMVVQGQWESVGTSIKSYDSENGKELYEVLSGGQILKVCFSPDGLRFATAEGNLIGIYAARDGTRLKEFKGHWGSITDIKFSPDGYRIVSSGTDGTIKIWGLENDNWRIDLKDSNDEFGTTTGIAWSNDGRLVAGASGNQIKIWDVLSLQLRQTLETGSDVSSIAFSGQENYLAAVCSKSIMAWDFSTGEIIFDYPGRFGVPTQVAFYPSTNFLLADGKSWDLEARSPRVKAKFDGGEYFSLVKFSRGNRLLAVRNKEIDLFETASAQLLKSFTEHKRRISCIDLVGDSHLISLSFSGELYLWNILTGERVNSFNNKDFETRLRQLSAHPGGKTLATLENEKINLWDLEYRNEIMDVPRAGGMFQEISFSQDGKLLAVGGDSGGVELILGTDSVQCFFIPFDTKVIQYYFSQDDSKIFLVDEDFYSYCYLPGEQKLIKGEFVFNPNKGKSTRWQIHINSYGVLVVDGQFDITEAELPYFVRKSRPSLEWHNNQAINAELEGDLYGAMFHAARVFERAPSKANFDDFHSSLEAWENAVTSTENNPQFSCRSARRLPMSIRNSIQYLMGQPSEAVLSD